VATKATKAKPKSKTKTPKTKPAPFETHYVLFGLGADKQPRGAKFAAHEEKLITRAALAMGLRIGIADVKHQSLVQRLPQGRLHEPADKAVPVIPKPLYEELNAAVGGEPFAGPITLAKAGDALKPGHLVLADGPTGGSGWYESVIVGIEPGGRLRLRWRDSPGDGEFIRDTKHVALLQ
jgi:hypothetical protein